MFASSIKRLLAAGLFAAGSLSLAAPSALAEYPDRPIRMVVGFAAGGSTDIVARIISEKLGQRLGQQIIVENRPGAGSQVGAEYVATSEPDGYTIFMGTVGLSVQKAIGRPMPIDPIEDFIHVSLVAETPNLLVVNPNVQAENVQDLIEFLKANPGTPYASSGVGTGLHLSGEMFKVLADVEIVHVPYRGSGPALTDLIGGQIPFMFDNMTTAMSHVDSGSLKALAVTSSSRSPIYPDLPTMMESGVEGFDTTAWYGMMLPKGVDSAIVDKLFTEVQHVLDDPATAEELARLGTNVLRSESPEQFTDFILEDTERWRETVVAAGVEVDD